MDDFPKPHFFLNSLGLFYFFLFGGLFNLKRQISNTVYSRHQKTFRSPSTYFGPVYLLCPPQRVTTFELESGESFKTLFSQNSKIRHSLRVYLFHSNRFRFTQSRRSVVRRKVNPYTWSFLEIVTLDTQSYDTESDDQN